MEMDSEQKSPMDSSLETAVTQNLHAGQQFPAK